jgi:hypothetical protein
MPVSLNGEYMAVSARKVQPPMDDLAVNKYDGGIFGAFCLKYSKTWKVPFFSGSKFPSVRHKNSDLNEITQPSIPGSAFSK